MAVLPYIQQSILAQIQALRYLPEKVVMSSTFVPSCVSSHHTAAQSLPTFHYTPTSIHVVPFRNNAKTVDTLCCVNMISAMKKKEKKPSCESQVCNVRLPKAGRKSIHEVNDHRKNKWQLICQ